MTVRIYLRIWSGGQTRPTKARTVDKCRQLDRRGLRSRGRARRRRRDKKGRNAMHARVTRSETAPDKVDEGMKRIKEIVIPQVKKLEGFKGGFWLIDRTTLKGFGVTLFADEAALRATEGASAKIRAQAPPGVKITGVEQYEVVASIPVQGQVRAGRVTRFEGPLEQMEKLIKYTNETVVPAAKKLQGLKGGYWLGDRKNGKGFALTLFESESALRASEDASAGIRADAAKQTGTTMAGVERYEVFAQAVAEPAMAGR